MNRSLTTMRALIAVAIGLLGCMMVWVVVPYNNFWLHNTYLADTYLPEIVVAFMLLVVLAVNPLLRLLGARWMLTRRHFAVLQKLYGNSGSERMIRRVCYF